MLQRHYPVPVVVLCKICKIPLYRCRRLLIRRKTLTSEEELEFETLNEFHLALNLLLQRIL